MRIWLKRGRLQQLAAKAGVSVKTVRRVYRERVIVWTTEAEQARQVMVEEGCCPEGYLPDDPRKRLSRPW